MKKTTILILGLVILTIGAISLAGYFWHKNTLLNNIVPTQTQDEETQDNNPPITGSPAIYNFNDCVGAGYPVMESYPRQCNTADGQHFVEEIGNTLELSDKIILNYPKPNDVISSPLVITGQARGTWFFEASFPVVLTDWDGLIIASGIAQAKGDWMTEKFVPFEATLTFDTPAYKNNGSLILKKDNPSGLPEHDAALEIPILFATK